MPPYFVGLDVHKQVIAYCVKTAGGEIVMEGKIQATRTALDQWVKTLPSPWRGGLEALFSHWIFRHLEPHAARLEMGHPARRKAISARKKKSDQKFSLPAKRRRADSASGLRRYAAFTVSRPAGPNYNSIFCDAWS
jgi:hypothetical protein